MRYLYWLLITAAVALLLGGCTASGEKQMKHVQSNFVGLDRVVTLYSADGKPIKRWAGRFKVETTGGIASFIVNGRDVKIQGTYTIEER